MKLSLTVTGLKELIQNVNDAKREVPNGLRLGMAQAMKGFKKAFRAYPKQPPPANPKYIYKRGEGMLYIPTGRMERTSEQYKQSVTTQIYESGNTVFGTLYQSASYSVYLRGDLEDRDPAWMHPDWESAKAIVERLLLVARDILEQFVSAALDKLK